MIHFGIDQLLHNPPSWMHKPIGLVTNHAATTNHLQASRQALLDCGFNLIKLFSPEHGLDVQGADGHEMKDGTDPLTGLPIISLYSSKLAPSENDLAGIEIVLFDIPDVGSRFYTYLWTLTHVMEACAAQQKKIILLDRPNPVSGNLLMAEGPILEESQASFIGRWPIPIRHSCTLGELALYFNTVRKINCDLSIIRCENWNRTSLQPDWEMAFVPTSPAIRNFQSMLLYPGLCLLEATNISEGRGTDNSFSIAGAPWINGKELAKLLSAMDMEDLTIRTYNFIPADSKYRNENCSGITFTVKDPAVFKPVFFGLLLIRVIKQMYPDSFDWAPYPTMVNPTGKQHLDKLLGIKESEAIFDLPLPKFIAVITRLTHCPEWETDMKDYLLY